MGNDFDAVSAQLASTLNVHVRSAAPEYGGSLAPGSALPSGPYDAVFVIAEGTSPHAVQAHAVPMVMAATARLLDWNLGPVVLAENARVALGDEIGARMHAAMVVVLIGEHAECTAAASLSAYLTYAPTVGRSDVERHRISNIHEAGLSYAAAADKLESLMSQARQLAGRVEPHDDSADTLGPYSIDILLDSEPGKLRSSKK